MDIEGMAFHDLDSLNSAIRVSLTAFNDRRLSGRKESRRELFEEIEKGFLQPLPAMRYQMKSRKTATVMQNSFVVLNKHNYSVPKEYIGKRVDLIYDAENINIYYGLKLVTIHQRDDTPYTYTQKEAHGLPGHHGSYEKYLEEIYQRAGEIDYSISRGLNQNQMERLLSLDFVREGKNLFVTGSAGVDKSYIITATGVHACKNGFRTLYSNMSRLLGALKVAKTKGNLEAELKKINVASCSSLMMRSSCRLTSRSGPYCSTS